MARKKADGTVSKADAVRAALAEGVDAPDDGIAFIKTRFGIEMGKPMWSSYKASEKAKQAKKADNAPEVLRPTAPAAVAVPHNGTQDVVTSLEAVKALVDNLGVDQVKRIAEMFRK